MVIGTGTAIALGLSVGAGTAGTALAARSQAKSANRAADLQTAAANRALDLQTTAANRAADVQAKANADTLTFEREKEGTRINELNDLNERNLVKFNEDLARRQPYMNQGLGALAQMGQALPRPQAGAGQGAPYAPLYSQAPAPTGSLADLLAKQKAGA